MKKRKLHEGIWAAFLVFGLVGAGSTAAQAEAHVPSAEIVQGQDSLENAGVDEGETGGGEVPQVTEPVPESPGGTETETDPSAEPPVGEQVEPPSDDSEATVGDADVDPNPRSQAERSGAGVYFEFSKASTLTLPAGDGVRDVAEVRVRSNLPTSASLSVEDAVGNQLADLGALEFTQTQLVHTVSIPVEGLTAGSLSLKVETVDGQADGYASLTVGSGKPMSVSLGLSRSTVETWKSSPIRRTTAIVSARDETGMLVPFSGKVVTKVGGKSVTQKLQSSSGSAVSTNIDGSALTIGKAAVVAIVTGSGVSKTSRSLSLLVRDVSVQKVKVARSVATVYPVKDGYVDSVKLSVSASTSTGKSVAATGSVKITRAGKTVKSWNLKSSKPWSATWNGRVGSKVVPGTYKVAVALKGPQGATKTTSATIKVVGDKLVTKTTSKTISAASAFPRYSTYDLLDEGYCLTSAGRISCIGFDAYYTDSLSLFAYGSSAIPADVRKAAKHGGVKVRATLDADFRDGVVVWGYGTNGNNSKIIEMKSGRSSAGWVSVPQRDTRLNLSAGLGEYSYFGASTVKIEYKYRVLTK